MRVRKHRGREKLIFTLRREEPLAAQLLQNTLPYLICFTLGTTISFTACNDSRSCNKRGVSAQGREMARLTWTVLWSNVTSDFILSLACSSTSITLPISASSATSCKIYIAATHSIRLMKIKMFTYVWDSIDGRGYPAQIEHCVLLVLALALALALLTKRWVYRALMVVCMVEALTR